MKQDIARWNEKYNKREIDPEIVPDELLLRYQAFLEGYGHALDLASGLGDNALYLARRGYDCYCIDGSEIAMRHCVQRARDHRVTIYPVVADLDVFPLPQDWFNIIVVTRFLNRDLIQSIKSALRPQGWLLYRTFNVNYTHERPTFHPEYLLQHGELEHWFSDFVCVDTNDDDNNPSSYSYWAGQKP